MRTVLQIVKTFTTLFSQTKVRLLRQVLHPSPQISAMDSSNAPTETQIAQDFVHPHPAETLPSLLHRCLPRIQHARAAAYTRLNASIRRTTPSTAPSSQSSIPHPNAPPQNYKIVCAHVTEDLKLASEAVIELRSVIAQWSQDGDLPPASTADIRRALAWLDQLQDLEETKLVATVSLHALQRSALQPSHAQDDPHQRQHRVAQFAKTLNATDIDINQLLEEVLEFYTDAQEDAD